MTPEEKAQFKKFQDDLAESKRKIDEMYQFMQDRKRNQFVQPLDNISIEVLNSTFLNKFFGVFKLRALFFKTGNSTNPETEGQVVYHESSKTLKVKLNGTVKTITTA